jgi:hypothetical protein
VKTVANVAIRFLLAFCPFVRRTLGCAPQGLTMGMRLPSTAATRIEPAAVATERCWWKASKSRAASGRVSSRLRLEGDAGQLGNGLHRFQKRVLYGGLDQAALEFVGERPCGQGQRLVERKDARRAGPGVAHADEFHGSKDGGKGSGAQTAV